MLVAFIFLLVQHFPWWITLLHQLRKAPTCSVRSKYLSQMRACVQYQILIMDNSVVSLLQIPKPLPKGDGQETNNNHGKLLQTNWYQGKSCTGLHPWFDYFSIVVCIIMLLPPKQWAPDCPWVPGSSTPGCTWASCRSRAVWCEWTTNLLDSDYLWLQVVKHLFMITLIQLSRYLSRRQVAIINVTSTWCSFSFVWLNHGTISTCFRKPKWLD